jgi:hypothetical protein
VILRDRNWLEFLSVLDAAFAPLNTAPGNKEGEEACITAVDSARTLFIEVAERDGSTDRSGLLAQLELEKRSQNHGIAAGQRSCIDCLYMLNVSVERAYDNGEAHEGVYSSCGRQAMLLRGHEALLDVDRQ